MCGVGVLEQFEDTSVHLLSRLFSRVSTGIWAVLMFVTGKVDDDFIICGDIAENESSCRPSNFSNSFGSLAPGKSCLLANIKMGTPWKCLYNHVMKTVYDLIFQQKKIILHDSQNIWLSASTPFWPPPYVLRLPNRLQK